MTLNHILTPVLDDHPDVFERQWPLRVADIDRCGRLRLDAAARHIQDVGQDYMHELGFDVSHPLWIVRRTTIDMIAPIEFQDTLRLRLWCSGTSNRWCQMRVRIDGRKGGRIESEAFWININPDTLMPSRMSEDFIAQLRRTTDITRLRWTRYLRPGARDDADQIREYPLRFTDIDLFDHVNNSVYWGVVEDYLSTTRPRLPPAPRRVIIEHEAPLALRDKLEIITHVHPAGSTHAFGTALIDRTVTTLTYAVGEQIRAIAAIVTD